MPVLHLGTEILQTRVFMSMEIPLNAASNRKSISYTLQQRESSGRPHRSVRHLHDGVRGHGFIGGNDENVSQNCDCYDAQDDGPETVGELGGEFFDGVRRTLLNGNLAITSAGRLRIKVASLVPTLSPWRRALLCPGNESLVVALVQRAVNAHDFSLTGRRSC